MYEYCMFTVQVIEFQIPMQPVLTCTLLVYVRAMSRVVLCLTNNYFKFLDKKINNIIIH